MQEMFRSPQDSRPLQLAVSQTLAQVFPKSLMLELAFTSPQTPSVRHRPHRMETNFEFVVFPLSFFLCPTKTSFCATGCGKGCPVTNHCSERISFIPIQGVMAQSSKQNRTSMTSSMF